MSDGNPLTPDEMVQLVEEVAKWVGRNFSPRQAFQIARARLGFIGRITGRTFAAHAQTIGRTAWVDRTATFAQTLQAAAPAVAGFVARAQLAWWTGMVKAAGWLSPKAGAIVVGTVTVPYVVAGLVVLVAVGGGVYMAVNWNRPTQEPVRPGPRGDPSQREIPIDRYVPDWAANAQCDRNTETGGAEFVGILYDPVPYSGSTRVCRDRSGQLWASPNGQGWRDIVSGPQRGTPAGKDGCYSKSTLTTRHRTYGGQFCDASSF